MSKLKKSRFGFSLIELVVVIAIMAVLAALLAPALIHYVEDSRATSDIHSMDEVVNAVQVGLANPDAYDEMVDASVEGNVSCYIDSGSESGREKQIIKAGANGTSYYTFGEDTRILDEIPYTAAGNMRGVTITFVPNGSENQQYTIQDAIINKHVGGTETLAQYPVLYNRVKRTIGETVTLDSNTYKNSEFTIFIRIGSGGSSVEMAQDPIQVYGQYNGTNLPKTYTDGGTAPDREDTYTPPTVQIPSGGTTTEPTPPPVSGGDTGGSTTTTPTVPTTPTEPPSPPKLQIDLSPAPTSGYNHYDDGLHPKNIIPVGGTYTTASGEVFVAGDPFPEVAVTGDIYEYGDYAYGYNLIVFLFGNWMRDETLNGWGVRYLKDEATPPPILETINEDPVVALTCTFLQKKNVVTAPELPLHITQFNTTFLNCSSLTSVPARVPSTVTNIANCFQGCTSLNQTVEVPCSLLSNSLGNNNNVNATYYHVAGCDHDLTSDEFREITFSIDGKTFKAREDMSWTQWLSSEYNNDPEHKYIAVWYNKHYSNSNNDEDFSVDESSESGTSVARKEGSEYIFVCTSPSPGSYAPVGINDEIAENAQLYGHTME